MPEIIGPESLTPGVLCGMSDRAIPKWKVPFVCLLRLYWDSGLPILLGECRSLIHRISVSRKMRLDDWTVAPMIPPKCHTLLIRGPRIYRHAYIQDMRQLRDSVSVPVAF